MLDLIEMKVRGILPMVDEELRMPNGSDRSFIDKMHQANGAVKPYGKVLSNPMNFLVRHYAGEVVYAADGFLAKSKDRLNEDIFDLLQTSRCAFLKALFPPEDSDKESGGARKATLGMKFRNQLDDLMATLNATQPHYVRSVTRASEAGDSSSSSGGGGGLGKCVLCVRSLTLPARSSLGLASLPAA